MVPLRQQRMMDAFEIWIYQTWRLLQEVGVSCDLVTTPPENGILIGHHQPRGFLENREALSEDLFIVNIAADSKPHPAAHLHILQNKTQAQWLPNALFMPHWPHPSLIVRDRKRGSRLENIHFFGIPTNLATELHTEEWKNRLRHEAGLYLECKEPSTWHDYSDTDCVIAIRDFSRSRHYHKPATKLYNAWLAGVPFIGGRDSAYATDGIAGKNYLLAHSPNDVITQLKKLKNETLYRNLITNGVHAGNFFRKEVTLERWKNLIQETIPFLAQEWKKKSKKERLSFFKRQRFLHTLHHWIY